ncbi:MAG: hypothetical protein U9R44_01245 [Candidatus Omnitrophota bacterium]|nr:hypothetical protein [Candidatus Omnitrophota bacterium]
MVEDISKEPNVQDEERVQALPVVEGEEGEERVPIKDPLRVLKFRTINKKFGWWAAVVLLESYAKKQICFYLWQKKDEGWKRKQKFGIHSREDWQMMKKSVEAFIGELT